MHALILSTDLVTPHSQRIWQVFVNLLLLIAAIYMWLYVTWRAAYLIAMVPIAIVPFSYARLRLHGQCYKVFGADSGTLAIITVVGMIADLTMATQILAARSGTAVPLLHSPMVSWFGAIWYSTYLLLLTGYSIGALLQSANNIVRPRIKALLKNNRQHHAAPCQERRKFMQHLGLISAGVPLSFSIGSVHLTYDFQVSERDIFFPALPKELDGFRIAHLSDIHVGGEMDWPKLSTVAALTNAANPDIVLHTGDFLTHRTGEYDRPLYRALGILEAPFGQWACLGNHDFDAPDRLVTRLGHAGVHTLRNKIVTIMVDGGPLEIAGLDFLFQRFAREKLYDQIMKPWSHNENTPRLLLTHDPRAFGDLPIDAADLVLSGHTHGGHVGVQLGQDRALSVIGMLGIPDQGLYRRGKMQMFVTRCVGFYGYPMRLGIPPDISILRLRRTSSATKEGEQM